MEIMRNRYVRKVFAVWSCIGCLFLISYYNDWIKADPGNLDSKGGHFSQSDGVYHQHMQDSEYVEKIEGCNDVYYPTYNFNKIQHHSIDSIVNANTIAVNILGEKTIVRMIGVDAPENKWIERHVTESKNYVYNMLKGECVYLIEDPFQSDKDDAGNLLRYVFRYPDYTFVNAEMIRNGQANLFADYDFEYRTMFFELEILAKRHKKGLWRHW